MYLPVVVQGQHTQAASGVGERKRLIGKCRLMNADGLLKGLEGVGQIGRLRAYIGILPLQIADVPPCPLELAGVLAYRHIQKQRGAAGAGGERGDDGGIDAAGNAYDEPFCICLSGVFVQPSDNMCDNCLRIHFSSCRKYPHHSLPAVQFE